MERLVRAAVYLGMGIGVTLFGLLLFSILPHILDNSFDDWNRLFVADLSEEETLEKFQQHPAYLAMYERFPDASQQVTFDKYFDGHMEIGAMNSSNGHQLILDMRYVEHEQRIRTHLYCNTLTDTQNFATNDLFVADEIKNTDCLDPKNIVDSQQ